MVYAYRENDVKPKTAGGLTPEMKSLLTPGDFETPRRLPTPPTTASRGNMDNFRAHLLELRQPGSTAVSGRPMRGALGVMGISRQQTPSITFHSGTRRAVGSWSQRDVILSSRMYNIVGFSFHVYSL